MQIWQPGFHECTVRDAQDFRIKAEYIRMNPVESRLVEKSEQWDYSSGSGRFQLDEWPTNFASEAKASALGGASCRS